MVSAPPNAPARAPVLAVSSNKGGVGKTTVAANLAIFVRALREDLPVLVVGLDDQQVLDRMFALRPLLPGEGNLKHGWAERSLARVIQLGQYGVHFVPSPPDLTLLKARAEDPRTLSRILAATEWPGLVILDTKSDLEALTLNAYHAADRVLMPVADWSSLEEAGKAIAILERAKLGVDRARVVLTLVDLRTKLEGEGLHLVDRLLDEIERRGWPCYTTHLSRSPRVEMLNSGQATPLSILHHARGTIVHSQMRDLASEVLADLGLAAPETGRARRRRAWRGRFPGWARRWDRCDGTSSEETRRDEHVWNPGRRRSGAGHQRGDRRGRDHGIAQRRARDRDPRRLQVDHGRRHPPRPRARRGERRGDPPARRLDPGHLAREPDQEARSPGELRAGPRPARRRPADHDRRRRHGLLRQQARRGGGGSPARGARAEDDRQRPPAPARHPDLRIRDRARARDRRRGAHPRGHAHDRPLVLHRDDGAQRGPSRARRRQGGGSADHADPRGVPEAADPAGGRGAHAGRRDREAPGGGTPRRCGRDRRGHRRILRRERPDPPGGSARRARARAPGRGADRAGAAHGRRGFARGPRRQGDDRREGRGLRAALRLPHRLRSRLHARPRGGRREDPGGRRLERADHAAGGAHPAGALRGDRGSEDRTRARARRRRRVGFLSQRARRSRSGSSRPISTIPCGWRRSPPPRSSRPRPPGSATRRCEATPRRSPLPPCPRAQAHGGIPGGFRPSSDACRRCRRRRCACSA